jgi:hypothetical protein
MNISKLAIKWTGEHVTLDDQRTGIIVTIAAPGSTIAIAAAASAASAASARFTRFTPLGSCTTGNSKRQNEKQDDQTHRSNKSRSLFFFRHSGHLSFFDSRPTWCPRIWKNIDIR